MKLFLFFILFSVLIIENSPNSWKILPYRFEENFRGLSVVNDDLIWASGTKGLVIRSTDGGVSWEEHRISGADSLDFRDIHAFDRNVAVTMSSGTPARIYLITEGGCAWQKVWEDKLPEVFLDAMVFKNEKEGWILGDPINSKWLLLKTADGGKNWYPISTPESLEGEAAFAASGTNIQVIKNNIWFISGGEVSRLYHSSDNGNSWKSYFIPMKGGKTCGAFSFLMKSEKDGIVVGGDYEKSDDLMNNCFVTNDGGEKWIAVRSLPPGGYRSCISHRGEKEFITVGPNGSDYSDNRGLSWIKMGGPGFNTCGCAKKKCFAVGKGIIGKWQKN